MTSLLLIISFILHIITLTALYYSFKNKQEEKISQIDEMEQLLRTYLQEFKMENAHLQKQLEKSRLPVEQIKSHNASHNVYKEKDLDNNNNPYTPVLSNVKDEMETSLEAKVFQLYQQGLTEEEIAKQLNCGKTEVQLIIKLNKNS